MDDQPRATARDSTHEYVTGAFLLAVLLNQQGLRLRALFRAAAFVPCITPTVVIAIVFMLLFGTKLGLVTARTDPLPP